MVKGGGIVEEHDCISGMPTMTSDQVGKEYLYFDVESAIGRVDVWNEDLAL